MKLSRRPSTEDSGFPVTASVAVITADTRTPEIVSGGRRLGEVLVDARLVDRAQLAQALLAQHASGKRIGRMLVDLALLDERDLVRLLAEQLDLTVVDLGHVTPTLEAISLLPESMARALHVAPLRVVDDVLAVGVVEPTDQLKQELERATGRRVEMLLAPSFEVQRALDGSYRTAGAIEQQVQAFTTSAFGQRAEEVVQQPGAASAEAPVVQIVNLLITQSLRDRASDVHIEPQDGHIRIRFRIDGALHDITNLPASMGPALSSRVKIMAGMNIVERRRPQDGQIAMEVDGRPIDIRVSTVATIWGEKCVLRILDKSRPLYKLGDLGMPEDTYDAYAKLIRAPFGMMICAGPTGSGKTTTLYASLSEINDSRRNITTVEDPVEYVFPNINQIQINEAVGISFADGLKSILRQDPDVILVGESRDAETARTAIQSALTGHLVLSSLHATDTAAALHRLLDMGIESFLVASAVTGVVAQRLVRRICTSCKTPYKPSDEELAFWGEAHAPNKTRFYHGEGCNFCAGTGYQDRIGVYELMHMTPELRRLVVGWATQEELRRQASTLGMRSLLDEGVRLVANNVTTIEELIRGVYAGG
jgi:type IV pilus assembly protein PilB